MSLDRLRNIVNLAVPTLFRQISGGRVHCESEATLQLHLGRIISTAADLEIISERETFSIELEKPLRSNGGKRGRIDVWFRLTDDEAREWRCAIELKFFKRENHREPNNRYDVFKDIAAWNSAQMWQISASCWLRLTIATTSIKEAIRATQAISISGTNAITGREQHPPIRPERMVLPSPSPGTTHSAGLIAVRRFHICCLRFLLRRLAPSE